MIIEREPGFILFQFEGKDWKYDVYGFLDELKEMIPKEAREYDPENKTWHICSTYSSELSRLRKEFFTDKNQIEIEI